MKTRVTIASAMMILTTATASALAQGAAAPADPHRHQAPAASAPTTPASAAAMPMAMCRPMMGHEMAGGHEAMGGMAIGMGPMMRGAPAHPMDPETMAQMMEMRGEIMKPVGDIMMKHAKKIGGAGP